MGIAASSTALFFFNQRIFTKSLIIPILKFRMYEFSRLFVTNLIIFDTFLFVKFKRSASIYFIFFFFSSLQVWSHYCGHTDRAVETEDAGIWTRKVSVGSLQRRWKRRDATPLTSVACTFFNIHLSLSLFIPYMRALFLAISVSLTIRTWSVSISAHACAIKQNSVWSFTLYLSMKRGSFYYLPTGLTMTIHRNSNRFNIYSVRNIIVYFSFSSGL